MVDIVTRLGKGSPLTNAEVDANFTNLAEVSGVTGEPMGHEDRTTSTISFNASTRTFTIAPVASSFTVWCKGKKVVVSSAQTVTIPNTTGMYSIYYDANGVLSAKSGYFTFSLEAPTAYVYWNATTGTCPYFGDERHGVVLDWQTHEYLHRTRGAALASGFTASGYVLGGNGSSNSHAQITLDGGTFFDEDMKIIVTATNTPTAGTWEQDLLSPARIPVLYLSGTAWVIDSPTDYPLKQGTARPQYNAYSGGVWSTADVANNKYATSWILATNNLTYPVIAIIGQAQNDSQSAAEAVDFTELQLPGFPSVEFRPLYKLIFQCADSCTNAVHASLVSITDIRSIAAAGTAASIVTDHGNLSGLSDDDHPQYIHVDTLRTVSAAVKASFLPSQTSNAGKFLQTDGTATSWQALTSGNVTTALGFTPYNATNPSGYISGITSGMVTTALGFTPYNATNPSGYVTAAGARGAISVTGAGSYDSATGVINIVGGVTSFNTRTGAITLSSADVTTALGFTPYNNTNPSGYITGITSTMVTTALGFTPYNSSNPNGYISSITSANVTTALGFTPYNATNPSGYITSSALSGYLTSASAASTYLTDAMRSRGSVAVANIDTATLDGFYTQNNAGDSDGLLVFNSGGSLGPFQLHAKYTGLLRFRNKTDSTTWTGWKTVIHDGNYSSYTMPLSGGATWGMSYFDFSQSSVSLRITSGPGTFYIGDDDIANLASGALVATPSSRVSSGTAHLSTYAYGVSQGDNRTHFGYNSGGTYVNYIRGAATYFDSGTLQVAGNQVLHAGNYSSYAPTLTGGGASGTWGINVTGNANSANTLNSGATINGTAYFRKNQTTGDYTTAALWTESYGNTSTGIAFHISGVAGRYLEMRNNSGNLFWNGSVILNDGNYSSYAMPYSGGTLTGPIYSPQYDNSSRIMFNSASTYYLGLVGNVISGGGSLSMVQYTNSTGAAAVAVNSYALLHAGNYSSYALPLSGGTVSGTVRINSQLQVGQNTNGTAIIDAFGGSARFGRDSTTKGLLLAGDNTATLQSDYGNLVLGPLNTGYSHFQTDRPQFYFNKTVYVDGNIYQYGSSYLYLHSGNYNSYAPTLTGGNASGTWGINVTGTASKTAANSGYTRVGYGMAPFYNWGGANAGSGAPSDGTYTTGIDVGSHPNDQAYGFQIASNMWNVGLWTRTYNSGFSGWVRLLDSSNYSSYALPLSGGTMTGTLSFTNLYANGSSSYGIMGNNGYFDTVNSGAEGDPLELVYVRGSSVKIGTGTYGSKPLYAVGIYDNGNQVVHAGMLTVTESSSGINPDNVVRNQIGYNTSVSLFGQTDGGLYSSAYSSSWIHQIYGDFRSGQIAIRGKNSGTWQSWRAVLDSSNYSSYAVPLSGGTMSGRLTISPGWTTSGRNYSNEWIEFGNYSGLYSPINGAHFYPNDQDYGSWRVAGTRNGWYGLWFDSGSTLMMNGNEVGFHRSGYGWMMRWQAGTGYIHKGNPGGGTEATILDSSNYTNYVQLPYAGWDSYPGKDANTVVGGSWMRSYFTYSNNAPLTGALAHFPAGGYDLQLNGSYGDGSGRLAFRNRNGDNGTFLSWREILHAGNYTSYSPSLTGSGASGTWGISITGNAGSLQGYQWGSAGKDIRGSDIYADSWLRNYNSNTGLYNQATGNHWYSDGQYWNVGYSGTTGIRLRNGHAGTVLGYLYAETSGNFGLLHNNGGWAVQVNPGGGGTLHSTWTGGNIRANRANGNFYIDDNYGNGVVGVYSSYRYQGVFAMGDSYKLPADGTGLGTLYGMAWSHPNAGGAAGNLSDHGLLIINNGSFRCAISNSIVASNNITAYSDERLKTNWRDMPENFVARLAEVKVGIYDRIDEENTTQVGVGAQSFQKLLPQAIMTAKDEMGTLSVSYGNAALASAVELAKDNVELRARIERLESLINKLIGD